MDLEEKFVSSKTVYEGEFSRVRIDEVKLPNEKIATREIIERPNAVCVVALTKEGEILLVRQYRCPFKQVLLEVPAGKIDKGENPDAAVARELLEETGAVGQNYQSLGGLYMTPGFCDEIIYLYLCEVREFKAAQPDEDEFLQVEKVPLKQAVAMVLSGEIVDAKTCTAILKANLILAK